MELIRLVPGQVTILPGTRYLVWARWGVATIRCYHDRWVVWAPLAEDGQPVALVANLDHIGWLPLLAHQGRLASPPYSGMGRTYRACGSQQPAD